MGVLLVVLFLIVPIVEIYVIVQVGQEIGALPTIALLLIESAIGAWLVKREGYRAWAALKGAVETGRLPSRELADAALVLVGGTLDDWRIAFDEVREHGKLEGETKKDRVTFLGIGYRGFAGARHGAAR